MTDRDHPGNDPESSTSPPEGARRVWPQPRNDDERRALIRRVNELGQLGLTEFDNSEFSKTGLVKIRYKLPILNALPYLSAFPSSRKTK